MSSMLRQLVHKGLRATNASRRALRSAWSQHQAGVTPILRHFASQDNKKAEKTQEPATSAAPELSEVEKLTALVAEKEQKIAELNERTLRILAEMENVRTIARRDVDNAKKFGIVGFAKSLLSVADNLGLALKSVPSEVVEAEDCDPQLKGLFTGVKATESELLKVFSQNEVTKFGAPGDQFSPDIHFAMYEAPIADDAEGGKVLEVTKVGYMIGDRVLRPAEVGVSKKS